MRGKGLAVTEGSVEADVVWREWRGRGCKLLSIRFMKLSAKVALTTETECLFSYFTFADLPRWKWLGLYHTL